MTAPRVIPVPHATEVTTDQLEEFAWVKGEEITLRPDHAELRINGRLFVAPLPTIPAQRKGE